SQHKDVRICDAIRASMAFTGMFIPWPIKGFIWVDGGVRCNCPVTIFEYKGIHDPSVLVVWLDECTTMDYLLHGHLVPDEPNVEMPTALIFSKQADAFFLEEGIRLAN